MKALLILPVILAGLSARAANLDELIANRAAIERVYHQHRIGAAESFEQALPPAELRKLVERELAREKALRTRYGVEINSNQVAAEVARIERTTRAPDVLGEIKVALSNDPERFAESFAKPIVVERELRRRFENDDALHATVRHECEAARTNLLVAKSGGATPVMLTGQLIRAHPDTARKMTWSLAPHSKASSPPDPEAAEHLVYFDQLPAQLRKVLAAQLHAPGDVSAVIETPEDFLLFVLEFKNEKSLVTAGLSLPKLDCDTWLAAQNPKPRGQTN